MTSVTPKQRKDRETKIDKNIFRAIKNDASLINYICLKLFMNTPESLHKKESFIFLNVNIVILLIFTKEMEMLILALMENFSSCSVTRINRP